MISFTIRNLHEDLEARLRIRALRNGKSMEQEAIDILAAALGEEVTTGRNLADAINARFAPFGGVELELPERGPMRCPPQLD